MILPLHSELGVLKLAKIYQLEVAKIMHRIDKKKHPLCLVTYFQKIRSLIFLLNSHS